MLAYLTERKRQVSAINTFYLKTREKNQPQVGSFMSADISKAMLSKRFVFVLTIRILPNIEEDMFEKFHEYNQGSNWYNNKLTVGKIR